MYLRPDAATGLIRGAALCAFALAHMQDVTATLAPASLALVLLAYAPDLVLYRRPPAELYVVAAFALYFAGLVFINHSMDNRTAFDVVKNQGRILYSLSVFAAFAHIRPAARLEPLLVPAALAASAVVSIASLYSYAVHPVEIGGVKLSTPGLLQGLLGTHNAAAASLGTLFVLGMAAWWHMYQGRSPRILGRATAVLAAPTAAAFVLAKSRGWLLGIAAVALLIAWRIVAREPRLLRALVAVLVLMAGLGAVIVLTRDSKKASDNVSVRVRLWKRAARQVAMSPLIGIGPGAFEELNVRQTTLVPYVVTIRDSGKIPNALNYQDENSGIHAHNSYIQFLLDFGLLGSALYLLLMLYAVIRARSVGSRLDRPGPAAGGPARPLMELADLNGKVVLLTLVFLAIGAVTNGYVFYGPICPLYLFVSFGRLVAQTEALASKP